MVSIVNSIINTVAFDKEVLAKKWIKEYQPQLTDEQVNNTYNYTDDFVKKRISQEELNEYLFFENVYV